VQREMKVPETGLATKINPLRGREVIPDEEKRGGGSDDIGDISWNVPTVTIGYPVEHPGRSRPQLGQRDLDGDADRAQGHQYGAKVVALTVIDLLTRPELVTQAWDYFNNVQTKNRSTSRSCARGQTGDLAEQGADGEVPAEMKKYYYDPSKYKNYLDQLGIKYPTTRNQRSD
jgi:aminobenzoyl-glutamate utilization protein B